MPIPGDVFQTVQNALLSAYPTRTSLREMVRVQISELLDAIADGKNQTELVFDLVTWAETKGRLKELIDAAVRGNPKNPELVALVADAQVIAILNGLAESQKAANQRWAQFEQLWASVQDRYFDWIVETYGSVRIFGQTTPKPLNDIFTDVYVLDVPTAHRRFKQEELSEYLWNEDRGASFRHGERKAAEDLLLQGNKFYVLGKPGAGKTTFLKWLAVRETKLGKWANNLGKIPIFVPLKQYADNDMQLLDYIAEQFAVCQFASHEPVVKELLKSGRALVLFDGLDEVTNADGVKVNTRGHVALELDRFARLYSNCHIVISCRIAALDFTFSDAFKYLEMADFSPDQVEHFIRQWFSDDVITDGTARLAKQMLAEWTKPEHKDIRDLARSPLLLTLLCLSYTETQSFPSRRVEIYEEALDALLKKWDSSRQVQRGTLYKALSLGRKRQMFARIAYDAFVQNKILFEQSELEASLVSYLAHVPEWPTPIEIDGAEILEEIIAHHGIFTQQAYKLYSFSHLTLQEYFAAKNIVENYSSAALDTMFEHVADDKWREVILMTTSLLADATQFLSSFADRLQSVAKKSPELNQVLALVDRSVAQLPKEQGLVETRLTVLTRAIVRSLRKFRMVVIDSDTKRNLGSSLTRTNLLAFLLSTPLSYPRRIQFDDDLDFVQTNSYTVLLFAQDTALFIADATRRKNTTEEESIIRSILENLVLDENLNIYRFSSLDPHILNTRLELFGRAIDSLDLSLYFKRRRDGFAGPLSRPNAAKAISDYLVVTGLYYDCIQVAYTSDRRANEERILEPPPQ